MALLYLWHRLITVAFGFCFVHVLPDTTWCLRLTLYISYPSLRIRHFSEEICFLLLEDGIRNQDLVLLAVEIACACRPSQLTEQGHILVLFSLPVMSDSLWPHGTVAHQASLSLTISQSLPKFMSILSVMPSSDALFSFCPPSLPALGTIPVSWLFTSEDKNAGASASASVLPRNIQGWLSLRFD